mmetsp:Transcript_34365/g.81443  ORF Transcript_34365/g.81443 Transcript_34365/m.81443 type:complete len:216 (-) Transcript_34365:356-1003(-)
MHEDLDHSSLSCVLNAWNSLLLSDTGSKSDFGDVHELSNSAEVTLQNASVAGDVELGAITSRHTSRALSAQASRERSEPPARFSPRRALVDEEREPNDQVNGSKILAQLLEVCTDWSSADHPLTLHICLQVRLNQDKLNLNPKRKDKGLQGSSALFRTVGPGRNGTPEPEVLWLQKHPGIPAEPEFFREHVPSRPRRPLPRSRKPLVCSAVPPHN